MISRIDDGPPRHAPAEPPRRRRRRPLDARMRGYLISVAACGAALSGGSLVLSGARAALSTAIGAALATLNLWILARIVAGLLAASADETAREDAGPAWRWPALTLVKMVGLFAVVWLMMASEVVSPLAMIVGFGALPMGIAVAALVRPPPPETPER